MQEQGKGLEACLVFEFRSGVLTVSSAIHFAW